MKPAHYVIFHPEVKRGVSAVCATALVGDTVVQDWRGRIWVDQPPGNEDPLVLVEPWKYSFCHATQLKRRPRSGEPYVMQGTYIFFCNGQAAERDSLEVDTVFVVGACHEWNSKNPGGLPDAFTDHYKDHSSRLWLAHLQYGVSGQGHHTGMYTYDSKLWVPDSTEFSFLPLNSEGNRVSLEMSSLSTTTAAAIRANVKGKYPTMLSEGLCSEILNAINMHAAVRVVGKITDSGDYDSKVAAC